VWIIREWQSISPEVTVKGFLKCCISSAVDGTDNDMLWNGDVRSVRKVKVGGDSDI
jgi:hypothetical protein